MDVCFPFSWSPLLHKNTFSLIPTSGNRAQLDSPVSGKVKPARTTSVLLLVDVGLERKPPWRARITKVASHFRLCTQLHMKGVGGRLTVYSRNNATFPAHPFNPERMNYKDLVCSSQRITSSAAFLVFSQCHLSAQAVLISRSQQQRSKNP